MKGFSRLRRFRSFVEAPVHEAEDADRVGHELIQRGLRLVHVLGEERDLGPVVAPQRVRRGWAPPAIASRSNQR